MKMNRCMILLTVILLSGAFLCEAKKLSFTMPAPEELQMTNNPANPDESAMILLRESIIDDTFKSPHYEEHVRIKIFTSKGLEYATVEIPSFKNNEITDIKGRTIGKDGSIIELTEQHIFDKEWSKGKKFKTKAKSFTFPGAEPGCIVEYIYHRRHQPRYLILLPIQDEIYTKEVRYLLIPTEHYSLGWRGFGLSPLVQPERVEYGFLVVAKDIPGLISEDYSPPDSMVKATGIFFYTDKRYNSSEEFWTDAAKEAFDKYKKIMKKDSALKTLTSQIRGEKINNEEKLKKIYQLLQKDFHNLSYDIIESMADETRKTVDDFVKCRCGFQDDINMLFVSAAKSLNLPGYIGFLVNRDEGTFHKELPSKWQFTNAIAVVKLDDSYRFFSPGTYALPYNSLPGSFSDVTVMMVSEKPEFVTTPASQSTDNQFRSDWKIILDTDGMRKIDVHTAVKGVLQASWRQNLQDKQENQLKKDKGEELKKINPAITLDTYTVINLNEFEQPLRIEYSYYYKDESLQAEQIIYKIPLFDPIEKDMFLTPRRNNALCIEERHTDVNTIEIVLPENYDIIELPRNVTTSIPAIKYNLTFSKNDQGYIVAERIVEWNFDCLPAAQYLEAKKFWSLIERSDQITFVFTKKEKSK
ncbi:MAG: hypothetical protein A2Y62_20860 [Candidatus Fischerbacteria bacterium RBG_13_37_8]|uniref:DUF3857 domain-containing protein n=1 Tax=Candidatus Fischerbacteria bacterium RBG_13_37_8 TaxID=1817863 RepID=A0A1F5VEY7_9BACT|nr:MAG: hypothetical protein A2Y62_20860 [Candidatus Fischerbacteria bacterium RBG_13_37_8]